MSEREFANSRDENGGQMLESEGNVFASPPVFQLSASPSDPDDPVGGGAEKFPWIGMVRMDAWSSGFYSLPEHSSKVADIPKGIKVKVLSRQNSGKVDLNSGWLEVLVLDGELSGTKGYISSERVDSFSSGEGMDEGEAYMDSIEGRKVPEGEFQVESNYGEAIFYAQHGDRIFVVPADRVGIDPEEKTVNFDTLVHVFQDQGAGDVTTLYITYPDDDVYDPIEWYSQASMGGMVDIWGNLLHEFAQIIESMGAKDWNPRGMPPNLYVGVEAHKAIAKHYEGMHLGQEIYNNYTSVATILRTYEDMGIEVDYDNLSPKELRDKPDITNVSIHNLFEIKPWTSGPQAAAEVTYYHQIFMKAGIPMQLGPISDAGAKGALPVPGGYIVFYSPQPGVILYKKKNKKPEREPRTYPRPVPYSVPDGKPAPVGQLPEPDPFAVKYPKFEPESPGVFEWEYWEEVTGLTETALVIYLIVSEGTRLFPPRNFIPVP